MFGNGIPGEWLLTRQEMLEFPPHIQITNYAMLEHLLLFPGNAPLFHGSDLRFLILDEVHTYAGTQTTEVALLLRKLRRRLRTPEAQLRCMGTSASLANGPEAEAKIMRFAGDLFGLHSVPSSLGVRQQHALLSQNPTEQFSLSPQVWVELAAATSGDRSDNDLLQAWNAVIFRNNLPPAVSRRLLLAPTAAVGEHLARAFGASSELRSAAIAFRHLARARIFRASNPPSPIRPWLA
jgi:ATP-dependent helicase YprA (DUF1998 family)